MSQHLNTALEISEPMLEASGTALLAGSFDGFLQNIGFPYVLDAERGLRRCETPGDLRPIFESAHRYMTEMQVTLIARNCLAADFRSDDTLVCMFESRLISRGQLIEDPFPGILIMHPDEHGKWRVRQANYSMADGAAYREALAR